MYNDPKIWTFFWSGQKHAHFAIPKLAWFYGLGLYKHKVDLASFWPFTTLSRPMQKWGHTHRLPLPFLQNIPQLLAASLHLLLQSLHPTIPEMSQRIHRCQWYYWKFGQYPVKYIIRKKNIVTPQLWVSLKELPVTKYNKNDNNIECRYIHCVWKDPLLLQKVLWKPVKSIKYPHLVTVLEPHMHGGHARGAP